MSHAPLILVVEDDHAIRMGIVDALQFDGYDVLEAPTGKAAYEALEQPQIALMLLDLTLPGADGLDILDRARQLYPNLPVIIITARGGENERIKGLKKGADDYIPKPFSIRELLARVEAVLRRCRVPQEEPSPSHKQLGQGQYDAQLSILFDAQGQHVPLSEKENELMTYFLQHPQRIISRDELLQRVWRVSAQKLETRTVDMNISRLRDKLKRIFPHGQALKTQRGQGYIFQGDLA